MRPWRQLVNQQALITRHEQLDAENSYHIQLIHQPPTDLDRFSCQRLADRSIWNRHIENMILMQILDHAIMRKITRQTASGNDRDFSLEVDETFQHRLYLTNRLPGGLGFCCCPNDHLAFAIVAKAYGLEHGRRAKLNERLV